MSNQVITFHYVLTDQAGTILDSSVNENPLIFLSGVGQIIPGLESVLLTMKKGDKKNITVQDKDAYGVHDPQKVFQVEKSQLPVAEVKVGDIFETGDDESPMHVRVTEVTEKAVTLDGNHPLAGQDLTFAVEIMDMRAATAEEVSHGHVHGKDGHHHHH